MKDLKDKVIIVTGADGLIGRQVVTDLLEREATVICADINCTDEVSDQQMNIRLDLSDNASIDNLVNVTIERYGRIDGLINAAYPRTKDWGKHRFEDTPFRHWKENVDLQLNSVFYQYLIKILRCRRIALCIYRW